jgi:nucleoside-triphosphatase THEP1
MAPFKVISDIPAELARDSLAFQRYVGPIEAVLTDANAETPFTIGIFGSWGSGKSTVLRMVTETLATKHAGKFVCVEFDPWIHRREGNMLVPLLHTINDSLTTQAERFQKAMRNVGRILLALGSDLLLKRLTADVVSLKTISEAGKAVAEETGKVESEMRKLRQTLRQTANDIHEQGASLVLLIDNLDRCQPDQIIDVLESVKLFLDVEHVFVLLAIDKEVVDQGIRARFKDFEFGARTPEIGAEYLEKMVQLPLMLHPLRAEQVGQFIDGLSPSDLVKGQLPLIKQVVARNPRKIKRIINLLNVADAVASRTAGLQLKPDLLARIVVLRVQSTGLFDDVVRTPPLLLALEAVYQGEKAVDKQDDFQEYGSLRDAIRTQCKRFYDPESYLSQLFLESGFSAEKARLAEYLSMVGA